jgi:hypothetical protein
MSEDAVGWFMVGVMVVWMDDQQFGQFTTISYYLFICSKE